MLWQRRFGGTSEALGKTLTLNGDPYTVVGILPPRFVIPNAETEIMIPLRMDQDARRTERGSKFLRVLARLKPGVTPAQAQLDPTAISNRLRDLYPDANGNLTPPRVHHDQLGRWPPTKDDAVRLNVRSSKCHFGYRC